MATAPNKPVTQTATVATAPAANPFQPTRHYKSAEEIEQIFANGGTLMHHGHHVDSIHKLPTEMRAVVLAPKIEDEDEIRAHVEMLNIKLKGIEERKAANTGANQ